MQNFIESYEAPGYVYLVGGLDWKSISHTALGVCDQNGRWLQSWLALTISGSPYLVQDWGWRFRLNSEIYRPRVGENIGGGVQCSAFDREAFLVSGSPSNLPNQWMANKRSLIRGFEQQWGQTATEPRLEGATRLGNRRTALELILFVQEKARDEAICCRQN